MHSETMPARYSFYWFINGEDSEPMILDLHYGWKYLMFGSKFNLNWFSDFELHLSAFNSVVLSCFVHSYFVLKIEFLAFILVSGLHENGLQFFLIVMCTRRIIFYVNLQSRKWINK